MIVSNLAREAQSRLRTVRQSSSIQSAAAAFSEVGLGLIVVCDDHGRAMGVVSKSDLVRHLANAGRVDRPVTTIMTRSFISGCSDDLLLTASQLMINLHLLNLPLLNPDGTPWGTLDLRDALQALLRSEQTQEAELINYIVGVGYR